MKSIRLSLMVYFLGLVSLALVAGSLLVYHTTHQTFVAKKQAMEQLLDAQYQERCKKAEEQLNHSLVTQAVAIYHVVDFPGKPGPPEITFFNIFLNGSTPTGWLLLPGWLPVKLPAPRWDTPGPIGWEYHKEFYKEPPLNARKFNEGALDRQVDPQVASLCQINSAWGSTYWSPLLRQEKLSLPFDPNILLGPDRAIGPPEFDDIELSNGDKVRRVTLIAPYPRLFRGNFFPPPPRGRNGSDDKAQPRLDPTLRPAIVVQCATDSSRLQGVLAELAADHEEGKARAEAETAASLSSLQFHLLAIGLATFAATAVGGLLLVHLGLSPLQRLSEAVSRISEKDFRLQLKGPLPAELTPIMERLSHTLEELSAAFAREKQATADISHELRTPLAALLATIEVCLRKPRTSEGYRETLQECRSNGQQMNRLVERLLVLARLDAGVDPLRKRSVDLADLAEQCVSMVRPLAEAHSLQLSVRCPEPTPLETDGDKLREVLTNLLHNAIQYNRPHGSVELTVGRHNGCVRMQVRDTGIGIAPEARARIFERFYRADPSRHTDGLNSGLGLSIVKGYVDLMGGTIAVESTPGQGSTFFVDLPMHKA